LSGTVPTVPRTLFLQLQ
jgi:hypothetical protein